MPIFCGWLQNIEGTRIKTSITNSDIYQSASVPLTVTATCLHIFRQDFHSPTQRCWKLNLGILVYTHKQYQEWFYNVEGYFLWIQLEEVTSLKGAVRLLIRTIVNLDSPILWLWFIWQMIHRQILTRLYYLLHTKIKPLEN